MFSKGAAIVPSIIVFGSIILLYRAITYFAMKSEKFENIIEGEPIYVFEDGKFVLGVHKDHTFAKDEFLSEMRQESIEHLGQVKIAILETTGNTVFTTIKMTRSTLVYQYYQNLIRKKCIRLLRKIYMRVPIVEIQKTYKPDIIVVPDVIKKNGSLQSIMSD